MTDPADDVAAVLTAEGQRLRDLVRTLSDADLVAPSGCHGWRVADAVVHLRFGAETILHGLAAVTDDPVDCDSVTYWRDWPGDGETTFADVRMTWATTAAYCSGDELRSHFDDMTTGVLQGVAVPLSGNRRFQGHVLTVDDFLTTWVTEYALHHYDLIAHLPDRPGPTPDAVELTARTLEGLVGVPRPSEWDVSTYVRKASGRMPLGEQDVEVLGEVAARLPAMG